jgi:hypothetical protein
MNSTDDKQPVVLNEIDIPFTSLVLFFVKCALALIPAAIIFSLIMWTVTGLVIGGVAAGAFNPRAVAIAMAIGVFFAFMAWLLDFTSRNLNVGRRARIRRQP